MHPQLLCHPSNRSRPKLILPSDLLEQLHLRSPFHSAPLFFLNSKQRLALLQLQGWGQMKLWKGANVEYVNHKLLLGSVPQFSDLIALAHSALPVIAGGESHYAGAFFVTGNFFSGLGLNP